jgi:hypothetical protein
MKTTITKFNPKFQNDNLEIEENFCNQLKEVLKNDYLSDEYYEYLSLKLDFLKSKLENTYDEIYLLEFQEERNHPDEDVYDDYNNPNYASCEYYEERIKEYETEMKQLEDDFNKKDKEMRELKVA